MPPHDVYDEGEPPEVASFTVSNQILVKIRAVDRVSDVLDDAIEADGDNVRVSGISFQVDEPEQFFEAARELATTDARERAERLAELLGVELGAVMSASESVSGSVPPVALDGIGGGGGTPISPGEGEVVVTVFVTYAVK